MGIMNFFKKKKASISQLENVEEVKSGQRPELVLIMGNVCSGKTTFRKKKFPTGYVIIDAGEIFIQLSQGQYYNFPSHLEDEMNLIGLDLMRSSINYRYNIVIELIGAHQKPLEDLLRLAKKIGYATRGEFLRCDMEVMVQRNANRGDDNISAHYCEPYHIKWFMQAAMEYFVSTYSSSYFQLEKNGMDAVSIGRNIQRLPNDDDIRNYLCQKPVFRDIYCNMVNTHGSQLCAQLLCSLRNFYDMLDSDKYDLVIVVKYEFPTQFGQWDLFIVSEPDSAESDLPYLLSYLEESIDKSKDDIMAYLNSVIQTGTKKA